MCFSHISLYVSLNIQLTTIKYTEGFHFSVCVCVFVYVCAFLITFLKKIFIFLVGQSFYNTVVAPVVHLHGSVTGAHVSPHPETPSHIPPHPIPLCCPRALALSALLHAWNLHWSSVLHMVIHMFQCSSLISSQPHLLPHSPIVCSWHLCLFCPCVWDCCYCLSKFNIYVLIYYIGVF